MYVWTNGNQVCFKIYDVWLNMILDHIILYYLQILKSWCVFLEAHILYVNTKKKES